jgi:hypothetical protein
VLGPVYTDYPTMLARPEFVRSLQHLQAHGISMEVAGDTGDLGGIVALARAFPGLQLVRNQLQHAAQIQAVLTDATGPVAAPPQVLNHCGGTPGPARAISDCNARLSVSRSRKIEHSY